MNLPKIAKILEEDHNNIIRESVLDKAQRDNQIIYGARAINNQIPKYLEKETQDYDILTKKPKKTAKELVLELNRKLGREEFNIVKAKHKGTYKVKDSKGKTVVDYTQLKSKPKTKSSFGNRYEDISSIKRSIRKSLKNPDNEFRRVKDEDSLNRIKISEKTFNF